LEDNIVAYRGHFEDEIAGMQYSEWAMIQGGKLVSIKQDFSGEGIFTTLAARTAYSVLDTKGEVGSMFDQFKEETDRLPDLVRNLTGEVYGHLNMSYFLAAEHEMIDLENMPKLSVGHPMRSYFLK